MAAKDFLKELPEYSKIFDLSIDYQYTEEQLILFAEMYHKKQVNVALGSVSVSLPTRDVLEYKNKLCNSWGNTNHPDECYGQGMEDMYNAIVKELNER